MTVFDITVTEGNLPDYTQLPLEPRRLSTTVFTLAVVLLKTYKQTLMCKTSEFSVITSGCLFRVTGENDMMKDKCGTLNEETNTDVALLVLSDSFCRPASILPQMGFE